MSAFHLSPDIVPTNDHAVSFDRRGLERTAQPGYDMNWQIIFKNAQGYDYCRETKPGTMSRDDVAAFASRTCANHPHIRSAIIERW